MKDSKSNMPKPPSLILRFLHWFCDPRLVEDVEGDLTELYQLRAATGWRKADWLFAKDVLLLLRPGIIRNLEFNNSHTNFDMLYYHFKTAFRLATRYKGYALLNLSGLVVGLASCLLILLWVDDEMSVDKFHVKSDRLYEVFRDMIQSSGEIETTEAIPQPLELELRNSYPEVEHVSILSWENELLFRLDNKTSYEKGRYASAEFFQLFSFPFLVGDPATALRDVHSVAISERLAKKFFGDAWHEAVGQIIKIDERQEFTVTGVFENPPASSSLDFDYILPAKEYIQRNDWVESWFNGGFRMYLTLKEGADIDAVRKRIHQEVNKHTDNAADEPIYLQRFADNYLYSDFQRGVASGGRIEYVRILAAIAFFILLIACINFMNLATARSSTRAREIGVKKVMGAQRGSLSVQFFAESFLHTIASILVALLIVYLSLPYFNDLTGKTLILDLTEEKLWLGIFGITLVTGLLSGSYPALLLSSFKTINSLKGKGQRGSKGVYLRHGLATFQFALSIFLIGGTIVVSRQMDYILSKDLGLDKSNVIMLYMEGELYGKNETYRTALQQIPEVKDVTFTSGNPLSYGSSTGGAVWEGKNPNDVVEINVLRVDADFLKTMDINLAEGQDFTNNFRTDSSHFLVNEVLADIMGFDNPVGKKLSFWGTDGMITGVVKDFHMSSLYEPIKPLIIRYDPKSTGSAFIRTQGSTQQAIARIEEVTRKLNPSFPFRYSFLDQEYANRYEGERAVSSLVNIFAIVSIFLSCLGLLGLSSFSADQRSKEIGIRKVHGARTSGLIFLLSRSYASLIAIAFVIAAPISYFYMQHWLNNFAFQTELNLF
ncbi:MAG TPA: ABC transporter permease, partial [Cyclobacteriaceae bacterium]